MNSKTLTKSTFGSLGDIKKFAIKILKTRGRISFDAIRSFPGVTEQDVLELVSQIEDELPVEVKQKKVQSNPFLVWEKVISLKTAGARIERAQESSPAKS